MSISLSDEEVSIIHASAAIQQPNVYGTKAVLNVWNPRVHKPNEFSLSQIWVLSGPYSNDLNALEAGWQVYPEIYGDSRTRFFIYWTHDGYGKSGCYNHVCPGFIQTNKNFALGGVISHMSVFGGQQYKITLQIFKDPFSKNWWLIYEGKPIGYWPAAIVPRLSHGANNIHWGGEVTNKQFNGVHTETAMGSGRFAEEGARKTCYIMDIRLIDSSMRFTSPRKDQLDVITEKPGCYNLKIGQNARFGTFILFGGPGRNPKCP